MAILRLPLGSRCIKYLMFIFNLLFVISGIILFSIGAAIHAIYAEHHHFLDDKFFSAPTLLIVIGSIIFVIAFFGCCGAVRENYWMILTFVALMVLVFILEFIAGISGYVLRNEAADAIQQKMIATMGQYNSSKEVQGFWDQLQEQFHCCGTTQPKDWQKYLNGLPVSCCDKVVGAVNETFCYIGSPNLHKDACLGTFSTFIKDHAVQIGGAGMSIAVVQALGIWFAVYLAKSIKATYETM